VASGGDGAKAVAPYLTAQVDIPHGWGWHPWLYGGSSASSLRLPADVLQFIGFWLGGLRRTNGLRQRFPGNRPVANRPNPAA
jgi:hypothetical protein